MRIRITVPPVEEQATIADRIEDDTASLSSAIDIAAKEIELVREYRTRLIADVVTGRIDVRGLAPAHIDDVTEDELRENDVASDMDEILEDEGTPLVEEAADEDY